MRKCRDILVLVLALAVLAAGCATQEQGAASAPTDTEPAEAVPLADLGALTGFSYHYSTGEEEGVLCELALEDGVYRLRAREDGPDGLDLPDTELPDGEVDRLVALLEAHNIGAWDGFAEQVMSVEGGGFALSATFAGGRSLSAEGREAYPDGFREANDDLLHWIYQMAEQLSGMTVPIELSPDDRMTAFHYSFGSYGDAYWNYTILTDDDGVFLTARGAGGVRMDVEDQPVPADTFGELQRILVEHDVGRWNGFAEHDPDVRDGYGFLLVVEYEDRLLQAAGMRYEPVGYADGHAALADYLEALVAEFE